MRVLSNTVIYRKTLLLGIYEAKFANSNDIMVFYNGFTKNNYNCIVQMLCGLLHIDCFRLLLVMHDNALFLIFKVGDSYEKAFLGAHNPMHVFCLY